ncbi:SRPBCC domain-containing protein [Flammeovirga aprica]|uniref:SRPBCC domain-containing protein n=1 Tax=Flammeovirga aprica JL-4 TaxID=694437 RepID=A0A7X9RXW0_9BACT|nr:SRPBCC domain-containing protein [Flammeovirga aprica]NME70718.1 SRPBCC domain-containing protein [Flammeovirga aprica JL-4]
MEIQTEILINATAEKVWTVLTNFKNYPQWNPFIESLDGEVKVGNTIKVKIAPPNGKTMTFKPKVLNYDINKELRWVGHLFFKGLFDGEHSFELIDNGDGTTTFKQNEMFSGLLIGLLNVADTQRGFEMMNENLKSMAEK